MIFVRDYFVIFLLKHIPARRSLFGAQPGEESSASSCGFFFFFSLRFSITISFFSYVHLSHLLTSFWSPSHFSPVSTKLKPPPSQSLNFSPLKVSSPRFKSKTPLKAKSYPQNQTNRFRAKWSKLKPTQSLNPWLLLHHQNPNPDLHAINSTPTFYYLIFL